MAQFKFVGDEPRVYVDFSVDDHTLEAVPGETYELIVAPEDGLFESVAGKVAPKAPESAPEAPVEPAN